MVDGGLQVGCHQPLGIAVRLTFVVLIQDR